MVTACLEDMQPHMVQGGHRWEEQQARCLTSDSPNPNNPSLWHNFVALLE
jgi:hypothetical protein